MARDAVRRPFVMLRRQALLVGMAAVAVLASATPALADDRPDGAELATAGGMMAVIMLFFAAAGLGIWWAWRNGEFEEPEEVKYEMLGLVEDEPDYWDLGKHDHDDEDDEEPEAAPKKLLPKPVVS
jgi:hypothetical protein